MYKNIIFDFDGVIINSHEVQVKALTESYKMICGEEVPPYDDFFKLSGDSLKNIFTQLSLPLEMIQYYQEISRKNMSLLKIYEDMIELLHKLNVKGYNCALCTGKERIRTIEILKYFDIQKYFKFVICSDDVKNPKPHPESIYVIMEKLNALNKNTVMVGDGINDIKAAQNAGIESIAVTWGDVKYDDIIKQKPSYISHSPKGLYDVIGIA